MKFKFFPHTADVKFRAYGKNLEEVFENSIYAVFRSLTDEKIIEKKKIKIKVSGRGLDNLLYNFLEEILFLIDAKNFFVRRVLNLKIDEKKFKLRAEFVGDDGENYEIFSHVKAVTYNEMFVKKIGDKWFVQVVLDV